MGLCFLNEVAKSSQKDNQAAYCTRYSGWNRFQKAGSTSPWLSIYRSTENFKEPVRSGLQRGRYRRVAASSEKPGAMQQINVEVKTTKNPQKTGDGGSSSETP